MSKVIINTKKELLKEAHGSLNALLIGIDSYEKSSGFEPLKTCVNDVIALKSILTRTPQLNVNVGMLKTINEKGLLPSRGNIIKKIKEICESTEKDERLLIYYSGHGYRIKNETGEDEFFLVPQDIYDEKERESFISFNDIIKWVNNSLAKQKIIILDACLSGPILTGKKLGAAKYSQKFLANYLEKTKGIAVISSSSSDEFSHSKSPDKDLSLFTYYLIKALEGEPAALDDTKILTLESLYNYVSVEVERRAKSYHSTQTPNYNVKANGIIVLGDFSKVFMPDDGADFSELPIKSITFQDLKERIDVKDILTEIYRWAAYSESYLEEKVNDNLGGYLEDEFGKINAKILNTFDFTIDSVSYNETTLVFPGGSYGVTYRAVDKKCGKLKRIVTLDKSWFDDVNDIITLLNILNISPQGMSFRLNKKINPTNSMQNLKTQGWKLISIKSEEIVMKMERYSITLNNTSIDFSGIVPSDIFGSGFDKNKLETTYQTILFLKS